MTTEQKTILANLDRAKRALAVARNIGNAFAVAYGEAEVRKLETQWNAAQ